jgi:hypothetical protein
LDKKKRLPFKNLNHENWVNIAIAAAITFYIIQIGIFIFDGNICQNYAFDFCAFWSAGKISKEISLVKVYDINLLKEYQKEIYLYEHSVYTNFNPCPVPYLPIFLIPFKFLALLDHKLSYIIWTFLNILAFILYLRFFTRKISRQSISWRLLLLFLLALPVFVNFREGQVNIILMIFIGEFLRTLYEGKPIISGLWLGGLLFKPQLLIIIIPFLLFKKSIRILIGFFISSVAVLISSFMLTGFDGFLALKNLLFKYSQGIPTNNIAAMMNWRMLGWHISSISSSTIGWGVTILGTIITLGITFFFFRRWDKEDQKQTQIVLLGVFAATCAATWHAHLHMSVILIPPMIYLIMKKQLDQRLFTAWIFIPVLFRMVGIIIAYFLQLGDLYVLSFQMLALASGLPGLALNLLLLSWAIKNFSTPNIKPPSLQSEEGMTQI